jgi:hypothetical protein
MRRDVGDRKGDRFGQGMIVGVQPSNFMAAAISSLTTASGPEQYQSI